MMMMMMMGRVMCVLAVVLCCACGYTMAAAAAVDNDSPSGRGVSRGAVEVLCGAGGALRVRPAAESEWLTCGAGSRVSACGKYADLCRQRTARTAATTQTTGTTTVNAGRPKAVMANRGAEEWSDLFITASRDHECTQDESTTRIHKLNCSAYKEARKIDNISYRFPDSIPAQAHKGEMDASLSAQDVHQGQLQVPGVPERSLSEATSMSISTDTPSEHQVTERGAEGPVSNPETAGQNPEKGTVTSTTIHFSGSNAPKEGNQGATSGTSVNTTPGKSNSNQQSPPPVDATVTLDSQETTTTNETTGNSTSGADMGATATSGSEETNTTTPQSPENTTTEAPTTTPLPPVTDPQIGSTITSAVKNKANVIDSSVSPVWMRTAAPLLIVAVLFSFTVY